MSVSVFVPSQTVGQIEGALNLGLFCNGSKYDKMTYERSTEVSCLMNVINNVYYAVREIILLDG